MRRRTWISAVLVLLLLAGLGAYTAFWFIVAGKLEDDVVAWAQSGRAHKFGVAWRSLRVGGFPLAFEVELAEIEAQDTSISPPVEIRAPRLTASAPPWDLYDWRLSAPGGLSATAGPAARPQAKLTAESASGTVAVGIPSEGATTIWLAFDAPSAEMGEHLTARAGDLWLILPPRAPQTHTERAVELAVALHALTVPVVLVPLANPVDEVAFGITLKGVIPPASPREAAAAWRDSGGTLELDHFAMRWGRLSITGSGTIALDADLQPMGGFSGAIEGFDELLGALVAAGRMRPGDARLARIALAMLAKAGPDGRPEISSSFTIQNGEMYLGPAKLGPAPRIAW